jgi:hypothetical protein
MSVFYAGAGTERWNGDEVLRDANRILAQRIRQATSFLHSKVKKNINVPVITGIGKRSGKRVVLRRSKPGEFPRRDTGELHRNVKMTTRRVGKNSHFGVVSVPNTVFYARILEKWPPMDRSFFERTAYENRMKIRNIIARPLWGKKYIPTVTITVSD